MEIKLYGELSEISDNDIEFCAIATHQVIQQDIFATAEYFDMSVADMKIASMCRGNVRDMFCDTVRDTRASVCIAYDNTTPAGMAIVMKDYLNIDSLVELANFPRDKGIPTTCVRYLYTDPKFRRQGVARAIISYLKSNVGTKFLSLGVMHNNTEAMHLYESFGFNIFSLKYCMHPNHTPTVLKRTIDVTKMGENSILDSNFKLLLDKNLYSIEHSIKFPLRVHNKSEDVIGSMHTDKQEYFIDSKLAVCGVTHPEYKIDTIGAFYIDTKISNSARMDVRIALGKLWSDLGKRVVMVESYEPELEQTYVKFGFTPICSTRYLKV